MWKHILMCGALFAFIAASAASAQGGVQVQDSAQTQAQVPESDLRMARFFAGAALIRGAPLAGDAERARFYRELEAVCGVTGKDALAFLERCRNNPAEWKKINDFTIPILTELLATMPTAPPKTALRAAGRKKGKL